MTAPSADIAGLLNTAAIGTSGTDLFVGDVPTTAQDFTILLLDTGGPAPVAKYNRDYRDIQVVVRSDIADYTSGWDKAVEIKNFLLGKEDTTIGSYIYTSFLLRSDIAYVGRDASNRPKFTINLRVVIDGPDEGNRLSIQ